MSGIELSDLTRFLMQFGGAVAGAASLWGFIFFVKSEKNPSYVGLAKIMFWVFVGGFTVFITGWFLAFYVFYTPQVNAHEGIVLENTDDYIVSGLHETHVFVFLMIVIFPFFAYVGRHKEKFLEEGKGFFLAYFLYMTAFMAFVVHSGELGREQLVYFLHNWHSILTVGTVVSVDILYLATLRRDDLRRALYSFFPFMSAAIWGGLGLDFSSAALVFYFEGIDVTAEFIFNQIVVAIIVLNGILLSGRETDALHSLVNKDKVGYPSPKQEILFGLFGSVSIVSWLTITFIDFVELTLPIYAMFSTYIFLIAAAFFLQKIIKKVIMHPLLILKT